MCIFLIRFVSVSDGVSNDVLGSNSDFKEVINFLNMRNGYSQPLVPYNTPLYPPVTYVDFPAVSDRLYERNKSMFLHYLICIKNVFKKLVL